MIGPLLAPVAALFNLSGMAFSEAFLMVQALRYRGFSRYNELSFPIMAQWWRAAIAVQLLLLAGWGAVLGLARLF